MLNDRLGKGELTTETVWRTAFRAFASTDIATLTDIINALEQPIDNAADVEFEDFVPDDEGPGSYSSSTVSMVLHEMVEEAVRRWSEEGYGEFMANSILVKIDEDGATSIQYIPVDTFELPED